MEDLRRPLPFGAMEAGSEQRIDRRLELVGAMEHANGTVLLLGGPAAGLHLNAPAGF